MCGHHKRKEGSLASFARKKDSEAGLQISDIWQTTILRPWMLMDLCDTTKSTNNYFRRLQQPNSAVVGSGW